MDRYTKGFVAASLVYFFLAAALGIVMGGTDAPGWVRFVHVHFNLLGFMSMMVYGVGYFILPRFNGRTLRWPSWVPVHFYVANAGLIGMAAASPSRPSAAFTFFAGLSVLSAAMFAVNLGATILLQPAALGEEEEPDSPAEGKEGAKHGPGEANAGTGVPAGVGAEIDPDMRVGEILARWPATVDAFVSAGFSSLGDPAHREQVRQMPITLRMACQRHNVDLGEMLPRLAAAAEGRGGAPVARPSAAPPKTGGLAHGEPIRSGNILGDILAVYPATAGIFRKYYGEGCFSCPGQATESVRQSALMHNVSERSILEELNRAAGFHGEKRRPETEAPGVPGR